MSILSPETLFKMLGVDPALVEQVGKTLVGGMAELDAMKQGFGNAMNHFSGRLSALEHRLGNIEALLVELKNVRNIPAFIVSDHCSGERANGSGIYDSNVPAYRTDPTAPGNGGADGDGGGSAESGSR